jgi:hypothetical protein
MRTIITIILIFSSVLIFGQQTQYWLDNLENPKFSSYELKNKNSKTEYLKYDFSTLLIPRQDFLGYIDSNFRRINIFFTSISNDPKNKEIYKVNGISIVGNNKCDFEGIITIEQVREYKSMHFGVDNNFENAGFKSQGILIGKYKFKENPKQKHSGQFEGIVTLNWYVDKFGIIHYDYIEWFSDRYRNNQYVGVWTDYKTKTEKTCNWGEHRIPFSGDLDIGAAEFSPNPKYFSKGWQDLKIE